MGKRRHARGEKRGRRRGCGGGGGSGGGSGGGGGGAAAVAAIAGGESPEVRVEIGLIIPSSLACTDRSRSEYLGTYLSTYHGNIHYLATIWRKVTMFLANRFHIYKFATIWCTSKRCI